jgi:hypothetical protein
MSTSTTPFWQKPGADWERIPVVPYESHREYLQLKGEMIKEYDTMVKEAIDAETKREAQDERLLRLAYIGLPWEMKHHLLSKGTDVFLKLTKGAGREWCKLVNSFLVAILDTATRALVFKSIEFPSAGYDEAVGQLLSYLKKEAFLFISDRNMNPMGYFSFFHTNFKEYRIPFTNFDDDHDHMIPMAKFQHIMAAFAMGTHDRLGSESCVNVLDGDTLRRVFAFDTFSC